MLAAGCHDAHKKAVTTIGPRPAVSPWARAEGFADDPHAVAGARVFAESGCLGCHTYLHVGSANLSSGDLSSIGRAGQGVRFFERYVSDPTRFGNHVMPKYGDLGDPKRLHDLAVFLAASKGRR